ncbi:MAG: hypothetical protein HRT99_02680, partial [Mycoplasmatales bacterium]|nr:hypothetical protein [Mycoplasmatales bacterium]
MKTKETLIFKSLAIKNFSISNKSFKKIANILITLNFSLTISFILFGINGFSSTFEEIVPIISKAVAIYWISYLSLAVLKMNQYSFTKKIINGFISLIPIIYSWYIVIEIDSWNLVNQNDVITMFAFVIPIFVYLTLWFLVLWFLERRTNPFLAKFLLFKSINNLFSFILIITYMSFVERFL